MEVTMRVRKMASMLELVGLAGPLYSVSSCDGCHKRNGFAYVVRCPRWR